MAGSPCFVYTFTEADFGGEMTEYTAGDYRGNGAFVHWNPLSLIVSVSPVPLPPLPPPPSMLVAIHSFTEIFTSTGGTGPCRDGSYVEPSFCNVPATPLDDCLNNCLAVDACTGVNHAACDC